MDGDFLQRSPLHTCISQPPVAQEPSLILTPDGKLLVGYPYSNANPAVSDRECKNMTLPLRLSGRRHALLDHYLLPPLK